MKRLAKRCKEGTDDKKHVSAYLDRALVKRVGKAAHASHRTLSGQIAFLLEWGLSNLSSAEKAAAGIEISGEV